MFQKSTLFGWVLGSALLFTQSSFASSQCGSTPSTNCPGYKTYTQGGWGACPSGNNPAMFLKNNFVSVFPNGLEIGCTNKYKFTSQSAIQNFLPSGGTAKALPSGIKVNPSTSSFSNVLAGQLVALTLNVKFDNYFNNFGSATGKLEDLVINSGTFANWTVGDFLDEANKKIGGCSGANGASFSTYNSTATSINEAYDNGVAKGSFLRCPPDPTPVCNLSASAAGGVSDVSCNGGSNGGITLTVTGGVAPITYLWSNGSTSKNLTNVPSGLYSVEVKDKNNCIATTQAFVNQAEPLVLSGSVTQSTSCVCNGTASVSISGGVEPYTITWSTGQSNVTSINDVCPTSNLSVTIVDANSCSKTLMLDPVTYKEGCNAVEVVSFWQGKKFDGSDVDAARSNPNSMKGVPEKTDLLGSFYALGFGGWAILKVDGSITDKAGADLRIVETTWHTWDCNRYTEKARIEVSQDMVTWYDKGVICQDGLIDIAPLPCISYVRITDMSLLSDFVTELPIADGFDVDGIECIQPSGARFATQSLKEENSKVQPKRMVIYPNPSQGNATISVAGATKGQILSVSVIDHTGREVKVLKATATGNAQNINLDSENLESGLYMIRLRGEGINLTQKMLKK